MDLRGLADKRLRFADLKLARVDTALLGAPAVSLSWAWDVVMGWRIRGRRR